MLEFLVDDFWSWDSMNISNVFNVAGQYISSYFAVPKPRSTKWRPILNLKWFNKKIRHYKFRMETFRQVREWLQPGYFLVGMDLKDQFLSVPMNTKFRKYLRFSWKGKLLQWNVLPFGLKCSPRVVTKLLKPIMAFLRSHYGILISIYMDDMILQAASPAKAYLHAQIVILVLLSLGWELNWEKSNLVPSQKITHLGFDIDTESMTASCPVEKIARIQEKAKCALSEKFITVHNAERLLGMMESVRPVTPLAVLNYRAFQADLLVAKRGCRIPSKVINLSFKSLANLKWWVSDLVVKSNNTAPLRELQPSLHLWSDASKMAAGAHSSRGDQFQRLWTAEELLADLSINFLELRAAKDGIKHLTQPGDIVRLYVDNQTACSYIARQGGTRSTMLCQEACDLWNIAIEKNISLLTPHWVSTKSNTGADFLSRHQLDTWEVKLNVDLFHLLLEHFKLNPTLDAFAFTTTHQLQRYMSRREYQVAVGRNALMWL